MKLNNHEFVCYGAYFYPFITVKPQNTPLTKPPEKRKMHAIRDVMIHKKYSSFEVFVTDDGFVAIYADKKDALKIINLIFSVSLLHTIAPARQIKTTDVCQVVWNTRKKQLEFYATTPSERNYLAMDRDDERRVHRITHVWPRRWVSTKKIEQVLLKANRYAKNELLIEDLELLSEGWAHIYEMSPAAGFMFSWIFIENFLSRYWKEYISKLTREPTERDSLKSFMSWTVYNYIEVFAQTKKMDVNARRILNKLRRKRNKFVHERKKITQKDAQKCFSVAAYIVLNQLERKNPFYKLDRSEIVPPEP